MPRNTPWRHLLIALAGGWLACCAPPGKLGGSIGADFRLSYQTIRSYQMGSELVVVYEAAAQTPRNPALGPRVRNQVVRLGIDSARQALVPGEALPLGPEQSGYAAGYVERYVVEGYDHLAQGEPFPPLATGSLLLEEVPQAVGDSITGRFEAEFADGRLLWGDFSAVLEAP